MLKDSFVRIEHIKEIGGAVIKNMRWNLPEQNSLLIETNKGNFIICSVLNSENKDYLTVIPYDEQQKGSKV